MPSDSRFQPVPAKEESERKNWFERHPKKALSFILLGLLLILLISLLAAEKLVEAMVSPQVFRPRVKRFIRLREYPPFHIGFAYTPGAQSLGDRIIHRIDEDGFIIPSKVHEEAEVTLVFLGGSTTECFQVKETLRFPYLVGRLLEEKTGLKVNSFNGAMAGNNSLHSLNILLNKVIPLNPRLVVMMHNINDLVILLYEKTYWNRNRFKSPIVAFPPTLETVGKYLQESGQIFRDLLFPALYAQFKEWRKGFSRNVRDKEVGPDEFAAVRDRTVQIDQDRLEREFRGNLETFIGICQARQFTPVLMTQPSRLKENPDPEILQHVKRQMEARQGISYRQFRELFDGFNQVIRETAARRGVPLIDLARQVPGEKTYMEDVVHLTEEGSVLVARLVSQSLLPYLEGKTTIN